MFLAPLALGLALAAAPGTPDDASAARASHGRYKQALLAKDGRAAAAVVDGETLAYYGRMLELALDADAATVRKLGVVDKLMVVRLRHEIGRAAVERLDGAGLFAHGVEKGWVDASSVQKAELGVIRVEGDAATGEFKVDGRVAPPAYSWRFRREGGEWRFCLMPLVRLAEPAIKDMVKQTGLDENAFVTTIVEKLSGRPVPATVWEPLRPPGGRKVPAAAR